MRLPFLVGIVTVIAALVHVSHVRAANENVVPVGNYVNIVAVGSGMTRGFFVQLWSHKDSLIGVLEYQDDNYIWGGASEGLLREVSYDETTGKFSFQTKLMKPCARKKSANCTPSHVIVHFKGVLNKDDQGVMTGVMEMRSVDSEGTLFREEVTLKDPGGGGYSRYENREKWLSAMKELTIRRNRGALE